MDLSINYHAECYADPNEALDALNFHGTKTKCGFIEKEYKGNIMVFRQEVYNSHRFERKIISVLDFDMPNKNGFDVMETSERVDYFSQNEHSYILLTSKDSSEFNQGLFADGEVAKRYISKWDADYAKQLLDQITSLHERIFQSAGYSLATDLSRSTNEETSILFDDAFLTIFNQCLKKYDICEGYLFDKQGSMMFLDKHANLSWLIIRNEKGVQNSIELAHEYGAPESVIKALKSKESILSLYNREDFESRKNIDWDKYLLKANVFEDIETRKNEVFNYHPSNYYYAYTPDFPEHGIEQDKILSYTEFLKNKRSASKE